MHREYHPEDMEHRRAHAFDAGPDDPHHHHHDHDHDHRSLYVLTALLGLLIGGDVLFGALGWESWRAPGGVSLALIAAVLGGARIVYGALEALLAGRIGADVALAQACVAAIILGEYVVAAEVVFIALVGEALEAITAERAMRSIGRLFDQTPRTARVRREDREIEIPSREVNVGDLVIVGPGERISVDGPVVAGRSAVDQAALTGEPEAIDKGPGDPVYTGTINQFGRLEVRAERVGHESTLGQVLRLVADAQRRKAPIQRTADRLARWFLPVVETVAALTLLAGYLLGWPDTWERAVAVLVVACPCALILATPAAIMASLAWLARHGIVLKGGAALERLAACDTFVFDKTGTLTLGRPELVGIVPLGDRDEAEILRIAAAAESSSRHPLAAAVVLAAAERGLTPLDVSDVEAHPGAGVSARPIGAEGHAQSILIGNRRLMAEHGITLDPAADAALAAVDARGETALLVAVGGAIAGLIAARDPVRPEAHDVIHDLKHLKISEIALLTGDRDPAARAVAKRVHIKIVESELLPADKARWIADRQAGGRRLVMVGDGINDAPALARADVGIALGGVGADLAAEAGDLVILGDPLKTLPELVRLARATVAVIRQNIIIFAFGLNALAMGSAALGILGPVAAAVLHQAGSLLVLLNAMRLLAFGDWRRSRPVVGLRRLGDSIRRWDDRLDPGRGFEWLLGRWRGLLASVPVLGIIIYATQGWVALGPDEVGLLRRNGRFVGVLGPGPHLRWPPPFEAIDRLKPGHLRGLALGFRSGPSDLGPVRWESGHRRGTVARDADEALMMTGDGQLVELTAAVQYRVDPSPDALRRFAYRAADPDAALRPLAESVVRSVVGRRSLEALLTDQRPETERACLDLLRRRASAYGLGVVVVALAFQDVHPPLAVVDAYRDVSRAESDRQRRVNEGEAYRATQLAQAEGRAAATVQAAEADRHGRTVRASGEADAFAALGSARAPAPTLTDHRLYSEALSAALAGKSKVILDQARADRRRHLIVPDVLSMPALKAAVAAPVDTRGRP